MRRTAEDYIEKLEMNKHPEGGWYKETYRSVGEIDQGNLGQEFSGSRNYSTSIYLMLQADDVSALHKINSDEIWHFYDGNGMTIHEFNSQGEYIKHQLGLDVSAKETPQLLIPAGSWFSSEVANEGDFCLVGCTVSPGFDFKDLELAKANDLLLKYPDQRNLVNRLCSI
ncbi:MAG: putative cupin superfamily sugar epimerase [Granulosicoccus sp.]|jgi:predicted cupin superfamily sugar epimerase